MKMEQTERSETSAHKIQVPENHPKERIQHSQYSENFEIKKKLGIVCVLFDEFICVEVFGFLCCSICKGMWVFQNVHTDVRIKPTSACEDMWICYIPNVVNLFMFWSPLVTIFREVFYEVCITKVSKLLYKYKILSFKYVIQNVLKFKVKNMLPYKIQPHILYCNIFSITYFKLNILYLYTGFDIFVMYPL